MTADQ